MRVNIAARAMYVAPLPLLLAGIGEVMQGDAPGMIFEIGAFALLILSAALLNEGLRAEEAYRNRTIARPPAIPRKLFAVAATGLGIFVAAAFSGGAGLIGGALFGSVAAGAQFLAFGADPMRRKGAEGASDFETDRVAKAIDSAEATAAEILSLIRGVGDRHLEARVERMLTAVRDVFRTVEEDPRDLTRARKFLSVYLTGARDATQKFAQLYAARANPEARADYEALLADLETSFRAHREELLRDDKVALDVEIEVLRERLHQEGV
ncbi:5-bromo-4-chloroindolyl phosphate hydrolysis family protein [Oceanibium sediminis]|uniref:5-bromo-4-chloroindolyl phosphate hydrolysis family protein n=1 Tax=Oceanibium sediminis TaxID=2026339 RepID=UPI001E4B46A8|nr:5-bromo-4-chloroindolyl phosphate hydrolysis family protein [Oceanibium sediminis]